jgi:FtsP/CotA-like multicopper oxidase with cupredoxin domain
MAPDGYERPMLVVNGQYPGPTIEANWGDWIVVHVQNNMQNNGYKHLLPKANNRTSIHWHGMHQEMTSSFDGVPGVSQCIALARVF